MVAFIVFALTDFAALVISPTLVVPGIQGITSGENVNSGLDFNGNWSFDQWSSGSTPAYRSTGGNPGGYLEMTLSGAGARGFWVQPFAVDGSVPFTGSVRLDVQITGSLTAGTLLVAVDSSSASPPDPRVAVGILNFTGPTSWTTTPRFDATDHFANPGTYYLKVAFIATGATGPVTVGFDNIRLAWTTDSFVYLFVPLPNVVVVYISQDRTVFYGTYAFLVASILLAAVYYLVRERKLLWQAFTAPLQNVGTRLRSRSAWIAVAQVWMAVTFFQLAFILLAEIAGVNTASPIGITFANAWTSLFDLAAASVREEFAFRILLIGVPMAIGSVALRLIEINRAGRWNGLGSAGRHVAGSLRYLIGGVVHSDASRETQVVSWAFLLASSAIFGLAHAPGWGWWKVVPAAVAGVGFGYLFLRHGVAAAVLAHFVNDYIYSLYFEGIGGDASLLLIGLLVVILAVAGAGFFAWYAIRIWQHIRNLTGWFQPPTKAPPALAGAYAMPTPPAAARSPAPPPAFPPPSPSSMAWPPYPPPSNPMSVTTVRESGRIPRDYTPTYVPPPYGYPPVRFQCPSCGWVEARYDAGHFTCTRCGRTA